MVSVLNDAGIENAFQVNGSVPACGNVHDGRVKRSLAVGVIDHGSVSVFEKATPFGAYHRDRLASSFLVFDVGGVAGNGEKNYGIVNTLGDACRTAVWEIDFGNRILSDTYDHIRAEANIPEDAAEKVSGTGARVSLAGEVI